MPTVAQLPQACREAAVHAALTCVVGAPHYFPPGWGPCSVLGMALLGGAARGVLGWAAVGPFSGTHGAPACVDRGCVGALGMRGGRWRAGTSRTRGLAWAIPHRPSVRPSSASHGVTRPPRPTGPRAPAPPSWHARRSTHNLFSGHTTPATRTGTRAPGLFKSVRVTNAPRRDACDYRALATVQSPAPSCPGGAKQTYYYCYYGPAGVHAGLATVAACRLCTTFFARPQPFPQPNQPKPFRAPLILPWPPAASAATGSPLAKKTGSARCDLCAHFRRIQAMVQGRALPPWHNAATSPLLQGVADALEAMARGDPPARGRREGSRSRSRSPCSAPGNDGKGKGKGKNKGKHFVRGKGKSGNPAVDMEGLVRSAAQAAADATAAALRGR